MDEKLIDKVLAKAQKNVAKLVINPKKVDRQPTYVARKGDEHDDFTDLEGKSINTQNTPFWR